MRVAHTTSPVRVFRSRRAAMPPTRSRARVRATRPPVIRVATSADVDAIHALIDTHVYPSGMVALHYKVLAAEGAGQ